MTKTKRKCPKNKCENSYLRQVKETKKIKKELICLKCQHTWTTAAKYAKEIKIANSEELASLKEITDAIHKQYEKVRKMVNHESSLTDLPVDTKSKIKIGSASGVKSKGDHKVIIYDDPTKEIQEISFIPPKPKKSRINLGIFNKSLKEHSEVLGIKGKYIDIQEVTREEFDEKIAKLERENFAPTLRTEEDLEKAKREMKEQGIGIIEWLEKQNKTKEIPKPENKPYKVKVRCIDCDNIILYAYEAYECEAGSDEIMSDIEKDYHDCEDFVPSEEFIASKAFLVWSVGKEGYSHTIRGLRKDSQPFKGEFEFQQLTTQVTRAHKPVIEIERVKTRKWFKPWTWF